VDFSSAVYQAARAGYSAADLQTLLGAGIDASRVRGSEVELRRRPHIRTLHGPACRLITDRETVTERVDLISAAQWKLHDRCTSLITSPLVRQAEVALTVAYTTAEVAGLGRRDTAAPALLHDIRSLVGEVWFAGLVESLDGHTGRQDALLAALNQVEKRWAQAPAGAVLAPYVVDALAFPGCSAGVLGLPRHLSSRAGRFTWAYWQMQVNGEASRDQARNDAVTHLLSSFVEEFGSAVPAPQVGDVDAMIRSWEVLLDAASDAAVREPEVIVAVHTDRGFSDESERLAKVFASWRGPTGKSVVVRCPAVAADWYHQFRSRWNESTAVSIADAGPGDTDGVLETLAGLWTPDGDGIADPVLALDAARTIASHG
jgi:hypothetical protein